MTVFEVRDEDIRHNIKTVAEKAGVPVWGVIKYNGYGVGLTHMAGLLQQCGVSRFAVSNSREAHALREAGFSREDILLISPQNTEEEIRSSLKDGAIFSIGSKSYADDICRIAREENLPVRSHLTLDTGLGRFGFLPSEYDSIKELYTAKWVQTEGLYSHFSGASSDRAETQRQLSTLLTLTNRLKEDGIDPGMVHIANSSAIFLYDNVSLGAVRAGSALVGRLPISNTGLKKVGTLLASVCEVKHIPKGSRVGYGGEARLRKDSDIAILSVGARGGIPPISFRSRLLNRYPLATVNGQSAKIISSSSFGHAFLDVTDVSAVPGDIVKIDVNPLRIDSSIERKYL